MDAILYTDAAGSGGLGAVLYYQNLGRWEKATWWGKVRAQESHGGSGVGEIFRYETCDVLAAIKSMGEWGMRDIKIMGYVDNKTVL